MARASAPAVACGATAVLVLVACCLASPATAAPATAHAATAPGSGSGGVPDLPKAELKAYLEDIADWIMTIDLRSNDVTRGAKGDCRTSIFMNGNLARVLLAAYKLDGNTTYLDEGLAWCDTLVGLQAPITSSKGNPAGYWGTGYPVPGEAGDIYIADTGTAVTTLAVCHHLAQSGSSRQASYMKAMQLYATFVTEGCTTPPAGRGKKCSAGWILDGANSTGALADGFYPEGHLDMCPYTIATGTTGAAFFSELYALAPTPQLEAIVSGAATWLANLVAANGTMPYWLGCDIYPVDVHLYQAISYTAEGVFDADKRFPALHGKLGAAFGRAVDFLVEAQNDDGTWGVLMSGDGQRSPRAVSMMQWHYNTVTQNPGVATAINKWASYILANSDAYGVKSHLIVTGFVGLVVADLVDYGVTFGGLGAQ